MAQILQRLSPFLHATRENLTSRTTMLLRSELQRRFSTHISGKATRKLSYVHQLTKGGFYGTRLIDRRFFNFSTKVAAEKGRQSPEGIDNIINDQIKKEEDFFLPKSSSQAQEQSQSLDGKATELSKVDENS